MLGLEEDRGGGLKRIHRVITRALKIAHEKAEDYQQDGFPEDSLRQGYALFLRSLVQTLRTHHQSEDEVAFPFLEQKQVQAAYHELMMDHRTFDAFLYDVEASIPKVEEGDTSILPALEDALSKIIALWHPHIAKEVMEMLAAALQVLSIEEEQELNMLIAKYTQEHGDPPELAVPFMLYNLSAQDRALMARDFPPEVVNQLVPGPWKEKWGRMQPFLLD
jgi:hemerythrin-like domain-containing protein